MSSNYSGDVTISGDEQTPIHLEDPENVHVKAGAVDGDLEVRNAEYVYTNTPAGDEAEVSDPDTEIAGSIEDAYVDRNAVDGDVVIEDAEDVFIEHGAVAGALQIVGDEQRFYDAADVDAPARDRFDADIAGWQRSTRVTDPKTGVAVVGGKNEVRIEDSSQDFDLYVTGWHNRVRVDGMASTVRVHFVGSENTLEVSAYTDVTVATDSGHDNLVDVDQFPVEDLIETSKSEAYKEAFIGRKKITYQEPAMDQEYCPGCGAASDAIVQRHQEDAFFLFGYPIYQFEAGSGAYECEECSRHAHPDVQLSEQERRDLLD